MKHPAHYYFLALLRIALGFILFWAFLDKTFGLGFSTPSDKSWLAGASPTSGFLSGVSGPFASIYNNLAGNPLVEWLYMLGLLFIGLALILGIALRIAGYSGALFMAILWTAVLWPKNNPFLDQHIVYLLAFLVFANATKYGDVLGIGKWWKSLSFVKKYPVLQ